MKLKLRGHVLYRNDTKSYFKDLIVDGNFGIVIWTSLNSDAGLFDSKYTAIVAGDYISSTIKAPIQLRQLFRFEPDFIPKESTQDEFEYLKRELTL